MADVRADMPIQADTHSQQDKDEDALLQQALDASNQELDAKAPPPSEDQPDQTQTQQPGFFRRVYSEVTGEHPDPVWGKDIGQNPQPIGKILADSAMDETEMPRAIMGGAARAAFETKDFLFGEPTDDEKSGFRKSVEGDVKSLSQQTPLYGLASGVSQFVTGLIGAGKLLGPIKILQKSKFAFETSKAALTGIVAMDPHEERLSNLVESFPELQNPITGFLSAKPDDSAAEGRLKNALESIGMDFALVGALKAFKLLRLGKTGEAATVLKQVESERVTNARGRLMEEGQVAPTDEVPGQAPGVEPGVTPGKSTPEGGVAPDTAKPVDAATQTAQGADTATEHVRSSAPVGPDGKPIVPTEVRQPDVVKTQEVTDKELDDILTGSKADSDAVSKYGSRDEAIANGYEFAKSAPLPWQKLRGTDQALDFVRSAANDPQITLRFRQGW